MAQTVFYRDEYEIFKCGLKIEGASLNQSKARLILEFPNQINLLFNGKIDKYGQCEVIIPPLKNVDSEEGTATLEVVAESTLFEPWQSDFSVKYKKSVSTVESNVTIEPLNSSKKIVVETDSEQIFKSNVNSRDEKIANRLIEIYENGNTKEKIVYESILDNYIPSSKISKWGKSVFTNIKSDKAKFCMYMIENTVS